jgi:septum formation protein
MLNQLLENYEVILASASPRRKQLLEQMDIEFTIVPKDIHEDFPSDMNPVEVAEYLSRKKADAFSTIEIADRTLLIAADTIVAIQDEILGKPADKQEAAKMLSMLSGKTHLVVTGVTLRTIKHTVTFSSSTQVTFNELQAAEIDYYLEHYQPFDKAGAYGIQEWIGHMAISKIEGSYYNVMGLPTNELHRELEKFLSMDGQ